MNAFHLHPQNFRKLTRACARYLLCLLVVLACSGCFWKKPEPKPPVNPFPLARLNPDTVVLEIGVLVITDKNRDQFQNAWRHLDAQHIPFHVRKLLDENGIRTGLAGCQLPAEFKTLMEPDPIDEEELNEFQIQLHEAGLLKAAEKMDLHQRIQNRAGQKHEIPLSKFSQTTSWTIKTGDGHRRPGQLANAQPYMAVATYPNGNGSVSLVLTPQFQHGELKNRITSFQSQAVYENAKESMMFDDLNIHATLKPGETIMVTCNDNESDFGQTLFENFGARQREQRILMIRLAQSQHDDLFSDLKLRTSVSTVD